MDYLEKDIEAAYSGDPAAYSKTRVSVKNPELQFKSSGNISSHIELDQLDFWHYEI